MLDASRAGRKFVLSKRQGHQMRSGIGRDKAACLADIESKTPIEGGIAEDENSEPAGGFAARNSLADQPAADARPLVFMQYCDRAERQRGKRCFHP